MAEEYLTHFVNLDEEDDLEVTLDDEELEEDKDEDPDSDDKDDDLLDPDPIEEDV